MSPGTKSCQGKTLLYYHRCSSTMAALLSLSMFSSLLPVRVSSYVRLIIWRSPHNLIIETARVEVKLLTIASVKCNTYFMSSKISLIMMNSCHLKQKCFKVCADMCRSFHASSLLKSVPSCVSQIPRFHVEEVHSFRSSGHLRLRRCLISGTKKSFFFFLINFFFEGSCFFLEMLIRS